MTRFESGEAHPIGAALAIVLEFPGYQLFFREADAHS